MRPGASAQDDGSWRMRSEQDAGACPVRPLIGHRQVYATSARNAARPPFVKPNPLTVLDAPEAWFPEAAREGKEIAASQRVEARDVDCGHLLLARKSRLGVSVAPQGVDCADLRPFPCGGSALALRL